jgi:hypothetical protein
LSRCNNDVSLNRIEKDYFFTIVNGGKMKANQKYREIGKEVSGFSFIVPMTMAIIVGFSALAIGAYIIGEIGSVLEDSFGDSPTDNEQSTIYLIGNVTDGFSSVVDIEIVVIIITALSMAILAVMSVGSRRQLF